MIKVLWGICILPNAVREMMGMKANNFGGWIDNMLACVVDSKELQLAVLCYHSSIKKIQTKRADNVTYYLVPEFGKHDVSITDLDFVFNDYQPDLLHVEGTEHIFSKTVLTTFKGRHVLSLQGIINGYKEFQYGELPINEMILSRHFLRSLVAWSLHFRKYFLFNNRLQVEKETLAIADNFLGRTTWDQAHSYFYNRQANYYHCCRILRTPFYETQWDITKKTNHTIYLSNGYSALKGAHTLVKAVALLKEEYPNILVKVAGNKPEVNLDSKSFIKRYSSYSRYLVDLIKQLNVKDNILFLGVISARQIVDTLIESHAYVLTSTIENSPNSLGEAMLLGVPCISSAVGGVADMAIDNKEALHYRSSDYKMLAWKLKKVFESDELALSLSTNGRKKALITHNKENNFNMLLNAYKDILK